MEPERFAELAEIWNERLSQAAADRQLDMGGPLKNLEGHLARAEKLLTLVTANQELLPTPLNEKLQAEPHPMIAIDRQGIIRGCNDPAAAIYGAIENQPIAVLPFDESGLRAIRRELTNWDSETQREASSNLLRSYRADDDSPLLMSIAYWQTAGGRSLLLVKTVDFTWPKKLTPLVQEAFELTDAETEVLKLMAEGQAVKEIAAIRKASVATVRTQVRAIYAKTATRNQSEFLRMAMGLTTLGLVDRHSLTGAFAVPDEIDEAPFPRPENRHLIALPDARLLDYAEFGAPDGQPVVFMHSEFFGDGMAAAAVAHAVRHNLRIIAPARPHNGRTSPYPKGVATYDQVNADLLHLLDHLGIDNVIMLSQVMAPSLFTMMFAHDHPDRVKGVVFLATLFPFGAKDDESKLLPFHRYLSSIIHRTPGMLRFISHAGLAYHNRVGSRRFFATFAEKRPADLELLKDDVAFAAMANGAQICGAHGQEGYYNDYRCIPDNIYDRFMALDMPVTAIIGDTLPQESVSNLHSLIANKPNYRGVTAQGGGQYIMFSHPRLVMDTVAALA